MALKKFARRDVILPAVVFLLTFVVALFSLRLLSLNQEKDERLRAVYALSLIHISEPTRH